MVRRARNDWIFSGNAARQLISGGDGAVASQPQPASRDSAVVVDRPWRAPLEHSEQRTPRANTEMVRPPQDNYAPRISPRQTRYEDAYGEDELGARHRCTEPASAEHGGQDGRRWEPASREHGFGRPALAQRSGGRASREVEMTDDRERSVHNPRDCSARAMLSQRQQQQLAAINSVTSRSPRATKESMPTEAEWPQEQPAAAATRGRRASKELMLTERKERLDGLVITAEDYGYTERHLSPRQRHYNAMARVDAEQAKQFGLQAAPFGLHGFGERPTAQTARDHYDGRPREAHDDSRQPAQPVAARASHDKREDDAGRNKPRNRRARPRDSGYGGGTPRQPAYPSRGTLEHYSSMAPWATDDSLAHAHSEARAYGMSGRGRSPERRSPQQRLGSPGFSFGAEAVRMARHEAADEAWHEVRDGTRKRAGGEARQEAWGGARGGVSAEVREDVREEAVAWQHEARHLAGTMAHDRGAAHDPSTGGGGMGGGGMAEGGAAAPRHEDRHEAAHADEEDLAHLARSERRSQGVQRRPPAAAAGGQAAATTRPPQPQPQPQPQQPESRFTPATAPRPPEPPEPPMPQGSAEVPPRSPRSGGRGARGPERPRPPGEWPTGGGVAWLVTGNTATTPQDPPPALRAQQLARMTQHGASPEELQPNFTRRRGVDHQEGAGLGLTNPAARTDDTWEEQRMFDRKKETPRFPPPAQGKLRRSKSFERPTRSSTRRAEAAAEIQEKLFDRKRLVASARAKEPPEWCEW